jgi:hypothetical protein
MNVQFKSLSCVNRHCLPFSIRVTVVRPKSSLRILSLYKTEYSPTDDSVSAKLKYLLPFEDCTVPCGMMRLSPHSRHTMGSSVMVFVVCREINSDI